MPKISCVENIRAVNDGVSGSYIIHTRPLPMCLTRHLIPSEHTDALGSCLSLGPVGMIIN